MRMNSIEEVAVPRSCHPTLLWIETRNVVLQKPMPMPIRKAPAPAQTGPELGCIRISTTFPASSESPPITAAARYEVRTMTWPAIALAKVQPSDITVSAKPATSGLRPMAPCT